jgi:hypothetical protein
LPGTRTHDQRKDFHSITDPALQDYRNFFIVDEIGAEEVRLDEQDGGVGGVERGFDFGAPFLTDCDPAVIPEAERTMPLQHFQMFLQAILPPLFVNMAVADEDFWFAHCSIPEVA